MTRSTSMGSIVGGVHVHIRMVLMFAARNSYGRSTARAAAPGRGHARRLLFGVWCCDVCELFLCCAKHKNFTGTATAYPWSKDTFRTGTPPISCVVYNICGCVDVVHVFHTSHVFYTVICIRICICLPLYAARELAHLSSIAHPFDNVCRSVIAYSTSGENVCK